MDIQQLIQQLETVDIQQLVQQLGIKDKDVPEHFTGLAVQAYRQFQKSGRKQDIDAAVEFARGSTRTVDKGDTLLSARLSNLGVFLERRYERTGEMADLEESIRIARQAVESMPDDHPGRAACLNNLGNKLQRRFERTGERADQEEAIQVARQAVESTPDDDPGRAGRLTNLANKLESRSKQTGEIIDLGEAIEVARYAVKSIPDDHPDRGACLNNLGNKLGSRYARIGEIADLEESIQVARQAIESTPDDHPDRAARLGSLGNRLEDRYERTGEIADLEEAIGIARQALNLMPYDHPDRAGRLGNLGNKLENRYERTGELADLEEATRVTREAVELMPHDHPGRGSWLNNLGNSLQSRYERTGEIASLEEAIRVAKQAVESTPDGHPDRAARLSNLGNSLESRYERTGEIASLEEAIRVARQAVESTPDDHPDRATWLNNLGIKLENRYERTGEIASLEEAIRITRQAVELTPQDHPDRAARLSNLGNKLRSRYTRIGEIADLEEAIPAGRQAAKSTPRDHPDRAIWLNNLGNSLESRYERTGEIADLEEATRVTREAVESTPDDHPNRAARLSNLGNKLRSRYERTGEIADLEEAIRVTRQAVESTPDDHPDRAARLNNLGVKLENRYEQTSEITDLEEATSYLHDAWNCQTAPPFNRIDPAARCLKLLATQGKIDNAVQLGQGIIDLLPVVNTKLLSRSDQQFVVSIFAGVAADLCAFLLASNRPADALDYLEKGRAIIIGQLVDARSDLSSLIQQHPGIAHRYEQLRDEVNTPLRLPEQDTKEAQVVVSRRREAVAELDACIQEIRGITGHERFLLGQTAAEMRDCAAGGTIVIVNVTSFQSHAILISLVAIKVLNLPRLLASDAEDWVGRNWTGRRSERAQKNKKYLEYLAWLWEVCVKEILDEVCGTYGAAGGSLPRIWWIGTGLGSSMPFHAAGMHSPGSTENAISKAISSYTPSIKALRYAQHRAKATDNTSGPLMIATMPTTPSRAIHQADARKPPDLPGVPEEKKRVMDITDSRIPIKLLDLPSVDQVVESLRGCHIAHFACHGSTDHADPSNSGLLLQKLGENQEAEQDRLTVHRISELSLTRVRIAYLSACSTAENKAERLSDEVIHVVSGFQVAGFPHVVGCLWPSIDRICVEVASGFYASLLRRGVTGWDGREVASALREAVLAVRGPEMNMPLVWAQFVHYGA